MKRKLVLCPKCRKRIANKRRDYFRDYKRRRAAKELR